MPQPTRGRRMFVWLLVAAVAVVGIAAVSAKGKAGLIGLIWPDHGSKPALESGEADTDAGLVERVGPQTIRMSDEDYKTLQVQTTQVIQGPPPDPLRLSGSLVLDPNRLVRVHSRFGGEVVSVGETADQPVGGARSANQQSLHPTSTRFLRFGDPVHKGQILAKIWSKDIGEKKSELVDNLSKLALDKGVLERLEKVEKGVVAQQRILDAQRNVEADKIAVQKAERTLRSWRLTEEEIQAIYAEAAELHEQSSLNEQLKRDGDRKGEGQKKSGAAQRKLQEEAVKADKSWAETEIRAPMDGVILEKNFNIGDIIDSDDDLFKIADLSRIEVLANVYEEDLPAIRALPPSQRRWKVDLTSDPFDKAMPGTFEVTSSVIDPQQHTGQIMGWLDNSDGKLAAGQFITATIELPADPRLVAVPTSAVMEEGNATTVFVETNHERHEFTRRKVIVVRRGRDWVHVLSDPSPDDVKAGAEPLLVGETVIANRALEFAAALGALKAPSAPTASK